MNGSRRIVAWLPMLAAGVSPGLGSAVHRAYPGGMAKGVLICKIRGDYDDCPEERYHFPRQYLGRIRELLDDWVLFYEPRRNGGRQVYFATAQVVGIERDPNRAGHYYALTRHYLEFDHPVPFREGGRIYERSLLGPDGRVNPGLAQSAVHRITEDEYRIILQRGFVAPMANLEQTGAEAAEAAVADDAGTYERPVVLQILQRPFRERAFVEAVRRAYDYSCAVTGWCLRNGGGRPEVQAAHIQPVAARGPDTVRNGLALSGTVHWMFDRGLISLSDDYRLLRARGQIPPVLDALLPASGVRVPANPAERPSPRYLRFHREQVFKG